MESHRKKEFVMKRYLISICLIIGNCPLYSAAVGQASGDLRNQVIKNNSGKPFQLLQVSDVNGTPFAGLYVMTGETMAFNDTAEPIAGAGYYEALPNNYYFVGISMSHPVLFEDQPPALRVDKVGWDKNGRLTTITGLRHFLESKTNIVITSDVNTPKIANGNLYIKLKDHGETEYWVKILFGKIVGIGKHQDTKMSATAPALPNAESYREIVSENDGFSFNAYPNGWEFTELGISGKIKRFCLVNNDNKEFDVELTHNAFTDSRIETKQFGVIIVQAGTWWSYSATESQIKKMKEFISSSVQSPASPTNAAPIPQAVDILKSKSEQGDAAAMYEYSVLLLASKEVPQNTPEAIRLLTKSAEKGYAKAQNDLGSFYAKGDLGVTKSQDSALRWYKAAADQNDQEGLYNLGICYEQGEGTPTDMARAAECYEKAAQLGFAKAQYNYGVFLREGRGIPQNVGKAVEWFQKAAAQDDAPALYDLGNCYLKGQGVASNPAEAVNYFSKAAKLGHKEAQNNLGFCYAKGQGVTQDFSKAIEYWTMAANQGGADACFNLGVCYASGRGTTVNTSEAAKWFRKADSLGHAQAKSALRSIGY
jgi:hypothetical protein